MEGCVHGLFLICFSINNTMNSIILLLSFFCLTAHSFNQPVISDLYFLPDALRGGATTQLLVYLRNQNSESNYIPLQEDDKLVLKDIMSKTSCYIHFQQKIAGIKLSLVYKDGKQKRHFLVLTDTRIIDLTSRIEYHVRGHDLQTQYSQFIANVIDYSIDGEPPETKGQQSLRLMGGVYL